MTVLHKKYIIYVLLGIGEYRKLWGYNDMRKILTKDVKPGMIAATDVFAFNNQLIISKGVVLNSRTISKLSFYSIPYIQVEEDAPADDEAASQLSYHEKIQADPRFQEFKRKFNEAIDGFKANINEVVHKNAPLDVNILLDNTLSLINDAPDSMSILTLLSNMRSYDDETYAHCVNVSLICNIFAKWLRLSEEEIKTATMCGLLHDIGKLAVPEEILKKPGKLTNDEYTVIKDHSKAGYEILRKNGVSPHICNAALLHHERSDGSGYPLHLKSEQIDPYAKIVAIADVYDATTSPRVYRGPMCPFEVIDLFEKDGLQKYDVSYILVILENLVNTYLLETVKLSDGRDGQVVFINKNHLAQPTIKIDDAFVDLSQLDDINIVEII